MSLTSALSIGRSGLAANQVALEVAGNNLANSATPGYTRQSAILRDAAPVEVGPGTFLGTGVRVQTIIRNIDSALEARLNTATADKEAADARYTLLSQVEAITNDLSDTGLSSRLSEFLNAWSELANNPADASLKTLVAQQGASLAGFIRGAHADLTATRGQLDDQIRQSVVAADSLLEQIAGLNRQIASAEGGRGGANSLRDERDQLIRELSELVDVSTVEQASGATDVFLGGIPLVLGATSRGLDVEFATAAGGSGLEIKLRVGEDGTYLQPRSGKIGSMIEIREQDMVGAIDALSQFAGALIYQLNRVHSQGQGVSSFSTVTGTYNVADPAASLTAAAAELDFVPRNGSFELHVTQKSTGTRSVHQINVDLDGIGGADMSLDDLAAAINGAGAPVTATVTVDGRLKLDADSSDFAFSFADDSSGVLASLGINTFFTGHDATDIGVNGALLADPHLLATTANHVAGGNATALAIAELQATPLDALGGVSLTEMWARHIEDYAVRASQADLANQSAAAIVESLTAQRNGVSGVSVDEEAIDLIAFQRAYQGSARFLSVVNDLMDTLIALVR